MNVFFERRTEIAPTIWEYYFRPERPVDYIAGQYVDLHVPHVSNDPRGKMRTFTLTSIPSDPLISFAAKFDTTLSPYKQGLQSLDVGDAVKIDDPMGDIVLPKLPSIPLIFVAGGLGIATFVAMTRILQAETTPRSVSLLYARRQADQKLFSEILASYSFASSHDYVAPDKLRMKDITKLVRVDSLIYLSGSQRFVESLHHELRLNNIADSQIVFDFFDGYSEL